MKKIFLLFAALAIVMQSCEPIDNLGSGSDDNTPEQGTTDPDLPADTTLSSIAFVPSQSGEAPAVNGEKSASVVVLDFQVTPKEAIATLSKSWRTAISCKASSGVNKGIEMPVVGYKANTKSGIISLTISGQNLPDDFFAGKQSAQAVVTITDGSKSLSSDPVTLVMGESTPEDTGGLQKFAKYNEVKILSFNVRLDTTETDTNNNWPKRKQACVDLIKDQDPCLIGFQEAKYTSQWLYLKEQLKDEYDGWGLNRDTGTESGSGEVMGILYNKSKVQKIDGGTFWLSETPDVCSIGWDAACKRTATWGIFRHIATGLQFLYINTHLDHKGTEARVKGLEQLAAYFQKQSASIAFLSGDMNVESTHSAFGVLSSFMSNTRDVAPKDHTDKNTTYNAYSNSKYSVIDHIYCTKTLKVVEYHTVNENYGVPYVSDHYPIYAIIKLL